MNFLKLLILVLIVVVSSNAAKTCPQAPKYDGKQVGSDCQCAQGIQTLCSYSGVSLGLTKTWKRDKNVKSLCATKKPPAKYAPIATFLGRNNSYNTVNYANQHAALFDSCVDNGIKVWDQYCTGNKKWGLRVIKYTNKRDKNDGASYYTF